MSKSTITPGPWQAQCPMYNRWQIYAPTHPVGVVAEISGSAEFLNNLARDNAQAIASVPDMIGELQCYRELMQKAEIWDAVRREVGESEANRLQQAHALRKAGQIE